MKNNLQAFRFKDPRQLRIYENLLFLGSGPAAFYRDACRLMDSAEVFESLTHLVGHCMREIESSLRKVVEPIVDVGVEASSAEAEASEPNRKHKEGIRAILAALDIPQEDEVSKGWLKIAGRLSEFAHRKSLSVSPLTEEFGEIWSDFQLVLDMVSQRFRNKYLNVYDNLDKLTAKKNPTSQDARFLKNSIPQNFTTLNQFFERCTNPEWLCLLEREGFFDDPPQPVRDEESKSIQFPAWPQSKYLIRMAAAKPKETAAILIKIPDADNPLVYRELTECANNLPLDVLSQEMIKSLVQRVEGWAKLEMQAVNLPETISLFAVHLAEHHDCSEAIKITKSLLEVLPDEKYKNRKEEERFYRPLPNPRPRFELWHYQEICKKHLPKLVTSCGAETPRMLADLLDTALAFSQAKDEDPRPEDFSTIWRPAIEVEDRIHEYDIKNILVTALRDASRQLAEGNPSIVPELIGILEKKNWWVFRRMALFLLSEFKDSASTIAAERITDRRLFENVRARHEYVLLISSSYKLLKPGQKQLIEDWIVKGPDMDEFVRREKSFGGAEPQEKDIIDYLKNWQRERLTWIKPFLSGKLKTLYDSLVNELGEAPSPHTPVHGPTYSWVGPTSPKSSEELAKMPVLEVVEFLRSWQPVPSRMEPTPEGLGRLLSLVVKESPTKYAIAAPEFKNLDPTYTRSLFLGLEQALNNGSGFDWHPVIELAGWVMEQPVEIPGRKSRIADTDPDWEGTRKSIASLLEKGFQEISGAIPFDLRMSTWEMLLPLTEDADPTPENEKRFGPPNMDPAMLSINTTRGEAMHALFGYALWTYRHLKGVHQKEGQNVPNFDDLPEVRNVLEIHLDTVRDPSLAVRATYGQWFPWLVLLDPSWAVDHAPEIFPEKPSMVDFYNAAWDTYLVYCRPYDNVFRVLTAQYDFAVERLDVPVEEKWIPGDPQKRLAEHLMTFYLRGKLSLNDQILIRFWQKAPSRTKTHALEFLGNVLRDSDELPDLDRFVRLWEMRTLSTGPDETMESRQDQLACFGGWFASSKLEEDWSLDQLLNALTEAKRINVDHLVAKRLSELATTHPLKCIKCLRKMVEGDSVGWNLLGWMEEAKVVIRSAHKSSYPQARDEARDLVNYLGSKGYMDFKSLLEE